MTTTLTARRTAQQRKRREPARLARIAAEQRAIEDARLLHEVGGAPLTRAAQLAAHYHRAKWTRVHRVLRSLCKYDTGRPARLRKEA